MLVENHSDVLVPWIQTGVRGAIVVNVDAHNDCTPISPNDSLKLQRLLAANDIAAIKRANSALDSSLYGIGDFITAACALGVAREVVWVAPQLRAPELTLTHIPFRTCTIESLPELRGPVFLTVDADIVFSFANYHCIGVIEAVRRLGEALRRVRWDVVHASVCFSVDGGFLPAQARWIGNALHEALNGKDPSRPGAPWPLLAKAEDWRQSLLPRELVRQLRPLVVNRPADPWLRVYLSDALFRAGDAAGALTEGTEAARLDPGCCRILPEIGRQLADANNIDAAERFLCAAPTIVNFGAELAIAQGLERAGRTARAIEHLSRISEKFANYSIELLIGYGYERLGDLTRARYRYLRAVSLLIAPVAEMPTFSNLDPAVVSAERLLRTNGNKKQAQVLRCDPRTAPYFSNDGIGKKTAGR